MKVPIVFAATVVYYIPTLQFRRVRRRKWKFYILGYTVY